MADPNMPDGDSETHITVGWRDVSAWLQRMGPQQFKELSVNLDTQTEYHRWLQAEGVVEVDDPKTRGHCSVQQLRADISRNSGYRVVSWSGAQQQMRQLCLAQQWREWDFAQLTDGDIGGELGERGTSGSDRVLPLYVKFHHRGVALHMLCASFLSRSLHLPEWLRQMASAVPCIWLPAMTKVDRLVKGFAAGAAMEHGSVKQSWLEVVLHCAAAGGADLGCTLRKKAEAVCPEHAHRITDWKNLTTLATRVAGLAWTALCNFMDERAMQTPPLPAAWLREPYLLLRGRTGNSEACTEEEQVLCYHRLLHAVGSIADAEGLSLSDSPGTLAQVHRRIPEPLRKRLVMLCKKYLQGMHAAAVAHQEDFSSLQATFLSGAYDTTIIETSDPARVGKFWPWVKAFCTEKQQAEQGAREAALRAEGTLLMEEAERMATEARQQKEHLLERAEQQALEDEHERHQCQARLGETLTKGKMEVAVKLKAAYRAQVRAHHQSWLTKFEADVWPKVEERLTLRREERAREAQQSSAAEAGFAVLLPQRKKGFLSAPDASWTKALADLPKVVLFDIALGSAQVGEEAAVEVAAAMEFAKTTGCVLILSSGDGEELAQQGVWEQAMLSKVSGALLRRIFLSWRQGPAEEGPRMGCLTILVNHHSAQAAREGSAVLRRLFSSAPLMKRGCVLDLPELEAEATARVPGPENRQLLATQRGQAFYQHLFEDLGLLGRRSDTLLSAASWDYVLLEVDAACGDALRVWLEQAATVEGTFARWVGAIPLGNDMCRSNAARHRHIQDLLDKACEARATRKRTLARQVSSTESWLVEVASSLPRAPAVPPLLVETLQELGQQWSPTAAPQVAGSVFIGEVDARQAAIPAAAPNEHFPAPLVLALAKQCHDQKVLVAPSLVALGSAGLYTTSEIQAGDLIVTGTSEAGKWLQPDEVTAMEERLGGLSPEVFTIAEVDLLRLFRCPNRASLVGNKNRDPWACMRFSVDGANAQATLGVGAMGNEFVIWTAKHRLQPYEEILWEPPCASTPLPSCPTPKNESDGPPAKKSRMEACAEAQDQGVTPEHPGNTAPNPICGEKADNSAANENGTAVDIGNDMAAPTTGGATGSSAQVAAVDSGMVPSAKETAASTTELVTSAAAPAASVGEAATSAAAQADTSATAPAACAAADAGVDDDVGITTTVVEGQAMDVDAEALSAERISARGQKLAELEQPKGQVYFLDQGSAGAQCYIVAQKKVKRIPGKTVLHIEHGGECSQNAEAEARVRYNLTLKSVIHCEGSGVEKLQDSLSKAVPGVWGHVTGSDGKIRPLTDKTGNEIELHWAPEVASRRLCAVLLASRHVAPLFAMGIERGQGGKKSELAPQGVVFMLEKPVIAPEPTHVFPIPRVMSCVEQLEASCASEAGPQ